MGDEKPWGTEGKSEIIAPTNEVRRNWKAARVRNPRLPPEPPMERAVALPLPLSEKPPKGIIRAAGPPARPPGMNSDESVDLDAQLRTEFEKTYKPEPTYNEQEQRFYDQNHVSLKKEYEEKSQDLIEAGELRKEDKPQWVSDQVFNRVRNFGKNLAYEEYRMKILQGH